jgi:hypothetical protein
MFLFLISFWARQILVVVASHRFMCVQITPFLRLSGLLALKYKQNPRLLVSKEKVANKMKSEHG